MLTQLLRLKFVRLIAIENTFFKSFALQNAGQLTPELLRLNYRRYSPYDPTQIVGYQEKGQLYVWFFPSDTVPGVPIPEAHLFFTALKKEKQDAIYLLRRTGKIVVMVVKAAQLQHVYALAQGTEIDELALQEEYGIANTVWMDEAQTAQLWQRSLRRYPPAAILRWARGWLDIRTLLKQAAESLAYPAAAVMIAYVLIDYFSARVIESRYQEKEQQYLTLKKANAPVREQIAIKARQQQKMQQFVEHEFRYPDTLVLLKQLHAIAEASKGEYEMIRIADGRLSLVIVAKADAIELVRALSATGRFDNIQKTQEQAIRNTGYSRIGITATVLESGAADGSN